MGRFSSNFKTYLGGRRPKVVCVAELNLPDGMWRIAQTALAVNAVGQYDPLIARNGWGQFPSGGSDRAGKLEPVETSIKVIDNNRRLMKLRYGTQGASVAGSTVTCKAVALDKPYTDAWTFFVGRVHALEFNETREVNIKIRVDDLPLIRQTPKIAIAPFFPDAKADVLGSYAPMIYGIHDSTGLSSLKGMVPCPYIDTIGFRYLVCIGRAKSIRRVYSGSTVQSSGFTVTYPVIDGVQWTLIDFTSSQGENAITVDMEGYETVGDGSGTTITNPMTQLKHFLVNFVWNTYRTGVWFSDSTAPIDTDGFTEVASYLDTLSKPGSRRFFGQVRGDNIVNEFADQHNVRFFWTNLGKLSVRPNDHRDTDVYPSDRWVRYSEGHDITGFSYREDPVDIIDRLNAQHCYFEAENKFAQELEVRDTALDEDAAGSIGLRWTPSHIV